MYKVIHNGMDIKWFDTKVEVNKYISEILSPYSNLHPTLKYNYDLSGATFLSYEYSTKYCEMFLIEEVGINDLD